ncbi:hypothetical protein D7X55_21270 [Corallococcus sp. AB049A]|uniref:Uncharacterized protein n=1 Tax=Corallococcus interemptor TaxID=2316720 RepID=A0A3A8QAM2_9BACT|nr:MULTISPECIES: hypothetical protein [Corallococcus]RKH54051.1 hypothetical protein D7Y23_01775 [Corallococcus sp. AB050B]RKH65729.1 hypothetical protein D7X96_23190 [Corallococcus interemptor]RKI63030.1 hypothetical protein D7X55_21270 [Corallococcus sp. AB049A]
MHVESPRSARSPKAVTFLRIPVLIAVGMMTMGSGMGNPGCSSSTPECDEGCAIGGTYTFQLEDTSPPGEGCVALGLELPKGPLVLTTSDSYVSGNIDDQYLSTYYEGEPSRTLDFSYAQRIGEGLERRFEMKSTVAAPSPRKETDRSVIQGEYMLKIFAVEDGSVKCLIQRKFTATR